MTMTMMMMMMMMMMIIKTTTTTTTTTYNMKSDLYQPRDMGDTMCNITLQEPAL
jgi:hypothetical protein